MNKLIWKGEEYELIEIDAPYFTIITEKPYPFNHTVHIVGSLGCWNNFTYKAIKIDDKNYGFKLIEPEESKYSVEFKKPANFWAALFKRKDHTKLLKLKK